MSILDLIKRKKKEDVMITRKVGNVTETVPASWIEEEEFKKRREELAHKNAIERGKQRAELAYPKGGIKPKKLFNAKASFDMLNKMLSGGPSMNWGAYGNSGATTNKGKKQKQSEFTGFKIGLR